MAGVTQEGGPGGHGAQDTALPFLTQVVVDAGVLGDEAHHGFGLVGVEVVDHDVPFDSGGIGGHGLGKVGGAVVFGPGGAHDGRPTAPVATSKVMKKESVPWRIYSYSRRSTWPGRSGKPECARSSACTAVISSMLIVRSPAAARAGASR